MITCEDGRAVCPDIRVGPGVAGSVVAVLGTVREPSYDLNRPAMAETDHAEIRRPTPPTGGAR